MPVDKGCNTGTVHGMALKRVVVPQVSTVDSALTHALWWTLKVMGFHGVWVPKEGLRLNGQIGGHQKQWVMGSHGDGLK